MLKTDRQKFFVVFALNLIIAIAYYVDNLKANYSELSSDIQNIIPVAQKFDDPSLFKYDLYLDTIDNVRYYTPFYVQTLRFIAKFTNHDYIQAINVLGFICHLLFGVLWFFLIYKSTNHFWVALIMSVFIRGIVWLPGLEIWGISDLWSIMPRTVYITLMPLPFLILSSKVSKLVLASFLVGLIFNFHPITGLGGVLLFCVLLLLYVLFYKQKNLLKPKTVFLVIVFLVLGMLPFVLTYFGKTSSIVTYDVNEYNTAFSRRIPAYFSDPFYFLKQWFKLKNLIYIIPLFIYLWVSRLQRKEFQKAKLLIVLTFVLIVLPLLSIPVEKLINSIFNLNLRLSFQLVRIQKVAIIPGILALAFLFKYWVSNYRKANSITPYFFGLYIVFLVVSHSTLFNEFPFLSDDVSRGVLPKNLSLFTSSNPNKIAADRMAAFINKNTPKDALFCASSGFYRGASKRSVTLDSKGASMIIEGNPSKFILWSKQQNKVMSMQTTDEVIVYLKALGIDYYITNNKPNINAEKVHTEGHIDLYKLQ